MNGEKNKMTSINRTAKFSKNKISATAIILLLIASMAGTLVFVPTASADTAYETRVTLHYSYMYCSVASNLIGIGQDQIFAYWTADMPPDTGKPKL